MTCLVCGGPTTPLVRDLFDDRYGAPGRHTVHRCQQCGFGRLEPGLKEAEIGPIYSRYYPLGSMTKETVRQAASVPNRLQSWLAGTDNIAHHYVRPGAKVLDIGSASGVSLLEINQLGAKAYGVEPDPNAARLARDLGLSVYTGFVTDNPFPGERFDFVTASQVIEHTPDPKAFLKAIADRLAPGGYAVLSFPNFDAFYRCLFGRRWLHWHVPYHLNFFSRRSLRELAEQVGLEVTKIRTITPNLWTIIQLRSLAERSEEGRMGRIWAAQHDQPPTSRPTSFGARLFGLVALRLAGGLILIINRLVDIFGLGESFLIVLRKK